MKSIFSDTRERKIVSQENIDFTVATAGVYLIEISARAQSEKQLGKTDDEDLRLEIDNRKFPFLQDKPRYFDSPAAFSGGSLHGAKKTVFFLIWLTKGKHILAFIPDTSATLLSVNISHISASAAIASLLLPLEIEAEDGDRRPWITFVFVDAGFDVVATEIILKGRFLDSDDVKVIIDGAVKRNNRSKLRKFWYFIGSFFKPELQAESFLVNLPVGLHYIEFWADQMPKMDTIAFSRLQVQPIKEATIQEKIVRKAQEFGLDPVMVLRLVERESQFNPKAVSHAGAKGLFQLTNITLDQIEKLGFKVEDVYDVDQNIQGGLTYLDWLYKRYQGEDDRLKKTLAAWNWGLSNVPIGQPLIWKELPKETQGFIIFILEIDEI